MTQRESKGPPAKHLQDINTMNLANSNKLIESYISECSLIIEQLKIILAEKTCVESGDWPKLLERTGSIVSASNMMGLDDIQNLGMIIERALKRLSAKPKLCNALHKQVLCNAFDKLRQMIQAVPNHGNISYREVLNDLQEMLGRKLTFRGLDKKPEAPALPPIDLDKSAKYKVLLVEDNQIVGRILSEKISQDGRFWPILAGSMTEARQLLGSHKADNVFAAVLDLNLPDAPDGEVVDMVLKHGIPSLVLTGNMNESIRKTILAKPVVDYIIKSGLPDLDYVVSALDRLVRNQKIKVLVVDDSGVLRAGIRRLLSLHCYQVLEAADGEEALETIIQNPGILVVITDYMMPHMDGLDLVRAIRSKFSKQEMVVIGVSSADEPGLSAKFLKGGANDFLQKPFMEEEFHCRVNQNVEMLLLFKALREASIRDYMTKLYNRRHFIQMAEGIFNKAEEADHNAVLAILDIDHFKNVNDTYGHHAGDQVLIHLAKSLRKSFEKRGLLARFGGEEFVLLLSGQNAAGAYKVLDVFRRHLENKLIKYNGQEIKITASIGVAVRSKREGLKQLIQRADGKLYEAKQSGRNRVLLDESL